MTMCLPCYKGLCRTVTSVIARAAWSTCVGRRGRDPRVFGSFSISNVKPSRNAIDFGLCGS